MDWIIVVSYFATALIALVMGHYIGFHQGVSDTERRWKEAVGKTDTWMSHIKPDRDSYLYTDIHGFVWRLVPTYDREMPIRILIEHKP